MRPFLGARVPSPARTTLRHGLASLRKGTAEWIKLISWLPRPCVRQFAVRAGEGTRAPRPLIVGRWPASKTCKLQPLRPIDKDQDLRRRDVADGQETSAVSRVLNSDSCPDRVRAGE